MISPYQLMKLYFPFAIYFGVIAGMPQCAASREEVTWITSGGMTSGGRQPVRIDDRTAGVGKARVKVISWRIGWANDE